MDPVWNGTVNAPLNAVVYLLEGVPDQAVAALPENYAYLDPAYIPERDDSGLNNIVPYIADNTVETAEAELSVLPGTGGAGAYDHVITTALPNARLVQIPVDGHIPPPIPGGNL